MPTSTPFANLITFSRGSNATVVGPNGLVQWAPSNLLTFSEQFDNAAWSKVNATVFANQDVTGGTLGSELVTNGDFSSGTTGWTAINATQAVVGGQLEVTQTAANARSETSFTTVIGRTYLVTAQARVGTASSATVTAREGSGAFTQLNTASTTSSTLTTLSFYFTATTTTSLVQLATPNAAGVTCYFDNISVREVTPAAIAAPDGTRTADNVTATTTGQAYIRQNATVIANTPYTMSIYLRAGNVSWCLLEVWNSGVTKWSGRYINLATGALGSSTSGGGGLGGVFAVTAVGNGWYRVTVTATSDNTVLTPALYVADGDGDINVLAGNGIFLWGAQLELGTAATTYNPTTVKNLLGFSEAFDNAAWTKGGASIVTGAQANPVNGLFNAQKLMEDTSTGDHRTFQAVSVTNGTPYVFSAYVKPAGRTLVNLTSVSGALMNVTFDVSTGVITSTTNGVGSIVAVGSGWYRIAVTATATSTASANFQIRLLNNVPALSYTGDGNSGIYIYGAQLSDSASLDPYVPTPGAAPSSTAYYGPRFDYNPATLQPRGILIEEQRTNLFTNSEFPNGLSDAPTRGGNVSATTFSLLFGNTGLAINNTGPVTSFAYKTNFTTVVSTTYTLSAFVRMNDGNAPSFVSAVTTDSANSFALVIAGSAVIPTTYTVTAMGNGFYRVSATATAGSASVNNGIVKYDTNDSRPFTVSGYQLEAGAFATSYIPTIASTVTRSADVATITGQNFGQWYGQTAGSFVVEFQTLQSGALSQTIYALALDTSGSKRIVYIANGGDVASTFDGTTIISASDRDVTGTVSKTASAYDGSGRAIVSNGGAVATGAVVAGYSTASTLNIGQLGGGQSFGWLRSIRYIPVRAADFQLQALTT